MIVPPQQSPMSIEGLMAALDTCDATPTVYYCSPAPMTKSIVKRKLEQAARSGTLRMGDDCAAWPEEHGVVMLVTAPGVGKLAGR